MKILLAGAFGNLGIEILRVLSEGGHEIIAADLKEKENNGLEGKYTFRAIDATKKETLKGICDGVDIVITTMGLTTSSTKFTAYDIDYQGNLNLLEEAVAARVKKFNYISVIACKEPGAEKVPMLHAKAMFEDELTKSGLEYVIYRPTGYFYDIAKVFKPYVDKGEMQLLKGYHGVKANVVDCTPTRRWPSSASARPESPSSSRTARSGCSVFWQICPRSKRRASMISFCSPSGRFPTTWWARM